MNFNICKDRSPNIMENKLRSKIEEHSCPLGTFVELGGASVIEALGMTSLDYVIIDNEHGPFDVESSEECIRACEHSGLTPFCRVREISRPAVMKLLDVGAQGLIVPFVDDMDQVRRLIDWAKYPPLGKRGYCASKKDRWGYGHPAELSMEEQFIYWNKETFLVPQCETLGALAHIEEIAAMDGVDGIFVGPIDLSISMGIPGQFHNPDFLNALHRILDACKAAGKFTMIFTGNVDWINDYYDMGFDIVTWSMDAAFLVEGCRMQLAKIGR